MNFITAIDNLEIVEKPWSEEELIPIDKLKDFVMWREKEFIEKYDGIRHETENDGYTAFEGTFEAKPFKAIVNTTLMEWDSKASHPWVLIVEIKFERSDSRSIKEVENDEIDVFDDEIMEELRDSDGYLNLGRETFANSRVIYFACKDFRKPSKVMEEMIKKYADKFDLSYEIVKDKYWKSLERFCS